ncbi:hypothetical protein C8A01DRAFT_21448, partial [Parachaetomium inaequale]
SGSGDRTVRVWDAATGAKRRVLRGHSCSVNAVVFSLDSRLIGRHMPSCSRMLSENSVFARNPRARLTI